jgi:hypothetical protein
MKLTILEIIPYAMITFYMNFIITSWREDKSRGYGEEKLQINYYNKKFSTCMRILKIVENCRYVVG